jgi:flavorubredoxin
MEPDHSASVAPVLEKYPDVTVVGSAMALKFLGQFMPDKPVQKTLAVKEGDTLPLGSHALKFFAAPMVHWPEVMVSLDTSTGILFSADAFGKFGALSKTAFWADEDPDWVCEGRRYYFNICGKYGPQVQALLKKLGGESISLIAPLHGPVIRKDLGYYLNLYDTWSSYGVETEGVFVAYASIHGGTAEVAEKVAQKLREMGCPKVATSDLTRDDRAEAVEDAFRYGRMVLAACSYDAGLFTPAHDFLHSLQVKGYSKRKVALIENGSWAPSAARVMKEMLGAMKEVEIVGEPVTIRSRYKEADEPALDALCKAILS